MPHRGSRVKETRGSVIGGATTSIFIAGADEAAHSSRNDEEIPGVVYSTIKYHFPPG
jgi:hypothetical protein